jgi:KaiC domain protein
MSDDDWFERDRPSGDDTPTEEDFEAAFDAGGGGDGGDPTVDDFEAAFGGGAGGGGVDEEFDQELDSDIPRLELGIGGLDQMIQGGIPQRSLMVVMGSAGTGKTTFGLQFLKHGIENDQKAVYITLEESAEAVEQAAVEKGWPFGEYVADDRLAIVDIDPIEMANTLTSIGNDLPRLIEQFEAERLVLDSVSLLEMMYDEQAKRRTEVFDFTKSLKRAGVTTMLTSEASETDPYSSKHGIIEDLTDAVFVLQYVRSEFQETRLAVEIQKIRNANHSRETKPYEITGEGLSVYRQADIF